MSKREDEIQKALIGLGQKLNDALVAGDLENLNTEIRAAFLHAFAFKNSPSHTIATMDFLDVLYGHVDGQRVRSEGDKFVRLGSLLFTIEMIQSKVYGFVDLVMSNYLNDRKEFGERGEQEGP